MRPILFVFSGLPATGKSTLAKLLAKEFAAAYLRIDTVEQGLRDLCHIDVRGEGYRLAYRIAGDNLRCGLNVAADSCNPVSLTRREWEDIARDNNASYVNIEVVCSVKAEHKRRAESRASDVKGLKPPTWEEIERRKYQPWDTERIMIDTANKTVRESFEELIGKVRNTVKAIIR